MLTAARGILRSVADRTFDDFLASEDLRLMTERRLEIMGEAARRLSDNLRNEHADIPWQRIIGLRNVLAHRYDDVDDVELWRLIEEDIPGLVAQLESISPPPPIDPEP